MSVILEGLINQEMKKLFFSIISILTLSTSLCQTKYSLELESALTDLSRCEIYNLYHDIKKQLTKLLVKANDTLNFYHDQQIIILYNEKKHKGLDANTFYIINHGFKRRVTVDILYADVENTGKQNKNVPNSSQFTKILNWHYENDTIYSNSYASLLISLPVDSYKKFKVKSCLLKITYADKVVYKWLFRNDELKFYTKMI